jgi:hypothetical protein
MQKHHARTFALALLILLLTATLFNALVHAQDATEYRRRASVLRQAVQRCSQRLLSGDITACTVDVGFDVNRTVSMPEAQRLADDYERRAQQMDREWQKKNCSAVRDRYVRDMAAIQRMQKTIQMSQQELTEWTTRNEEAQRAAIMSAINLLVDGGLAYVAESTEALNGLKGALAKYEKQLKRQKRSPDPLQQAKWIDMNKRILEMNASISAAKQLQDKKEKAEIFWGYFTANTKEVDESMNGFKAALNAVDEDPILHKLLVDKGLMPLVNRLKTRELFPKKPYLVNLLEFAADYGYSATEWVASRNRIIQQYQVSDDQLRAVNSMQVELKRTMGALNECVSKGFVTRP